MCVCVRERDRGRERCRGDGFVRVFVCARVCVCVCARVRACVRAGVVLVRARCLCPRPTSRRKGPVRRVRTLPERRPTVYAECVLAPVCVCVCARAQVDYEAKLCRLYISYKTLNTLY